MNLSERVSIQIVYRRTTPIASGARSGSDWRRKPCSRVPDLSGLKPPPAAHWCSVRRADDYQNINIPLVQSCGERNGTANSPGDSARSGGSNEEPCNTGSSGIQTSQAERGQCVHYWTDCSPSTESSAIGSIMVTTQGGHLRELSDP